MEFVSSQLKFDIFQTKVMVTDKTNWEFLLVGCGGTGSWLAPGIARVARLLKELGYYYKVTFQDPDEVEPKNVYRQNFSDAEIGANKAKALALRYSAAWGIEIGWHSWGIKEEDIQGNWSKNLLVIDAVDNTRARAVINGHLTPGNYWLSCGNELLSGQVLIGRQGMMEKKEDMILGNRTRWMPSPALQQPGLVKAEAKSGTKGVPTLSCAEMALRDSQGMSINQMIASIAADYLVRLCITQNLDRMATYIDFDAGSMRSIWATEEELMRYYD